MIKQYDFYLSKPVKFARAGGDAGESTLIVLSEPMYKHAGATAALKGCYTQAMLQLRERVTRAAEASVSESEGELTPEERASFIRVVISSDAALSEAIINAFIRLAKIPGIAAVDGDVVLNETHLSAMSYADVERMATS